MSSVKRSVIRDNSDSASKFQRSPHLLGEKVASAGQHWTAVTDDNNFPCLRNQHSAEDQTCVINLDGVPVVCKILLYCAGKRMKIGMGNESHRRRDSRSSVNGTRLFDARVLDWGMTSED